MDLQDEAAKTLIWTPLYTTAMEFMSPGQANELDIVFSKLGKQSDGAGVSDD